MRTRWALITSFLLPAVALAHAQTAPITQYSLSPDKLEKAHALYSLRSVLTFIEPLYGIVILVMLLAIGFGATLRNVAERSTRFRILQAAIVVGLLTITVDILALPFSLYGHAQSLKYGLSIQRWPSWFWDWTKGEFLGIVIGTLLVWGLYALIRRYPQRWWLYAWACTLPVMVFFIWLMPNVVDPMFHHFTPLAEKHRDVVEATQKVAKAAGVEISTDRMFLMDASEKVTTANAYVTGIGSSKRVVVWDTTIQQASLPEVTFIIAHEMGHYVLHHIDKGLAFAAVTLFFGFWMGFHFIRWVITRWGARGKIRDVGDWASLPVLMLAASILMFFGEPIGSNFSRTQIEHKADVYGLEITSQITPDYRQVAAQSFQNLGEHALAYPYPSKFMVFWSYDHPDISSRVQYALHYQPGDK